MNTYKDLYLRKDTESKRLPYKLYLDQKDYSRIARGLRGVSGYDLEVRAYRFLTSLVDSHQVVVYFSWCHLSEALRYEEEKKDLLLPYCQVIEALTNGNCIIWPEEIQRREVKLFLAKNFSFRTGISEIGYAYGKGRDAFWVGIEDLDLDIPLKEAVSQRLRESPLSGKQRRHLVRRFLKPRNLKRFVASLQENDLSPLHKQLPGSKEFLTKERLVTMLLGSTRTKSRVFGDFLDKIWTFKNLVIEYSQRFPELKGAGYIFEDQSKKITFLIKRYQLLHTVLHKPVIKESKLRADLVEKSVGHLDEYITKLAHEHGFSKNEARKLILKSKPKEIPSMHAMVIFAVEYYRKHKGEYSQGRTPLESDIMDLHHLKNLPYVDLYVTDKFFTEVAKPGKKLFGTEVFRNLGEAEEYLIRKGCRADMA